MCPKRISFRVQLIGFEEGLWTNKSKKVNNLSQQLASGFLMMFDDFVWYFWTLIWRSIFIDQTEILLHRFSWQAWWSLRRSSVWIASQVKMHENAVLLQSHAFHTEQICLNLYLRLHSWHTERDTGGGGDTYSKLSSGTHLDRSQIAHFPSNPCEQQLTQSAWSSDPTHPSNGQSTSGTRPPSGEATSNCNLPLCAYRNCLCLHLPNSELNLDESSSHDLILRIKRSGSWNH